MKKASANYVGLFFYTFVPIFINIANKELK